MFVLRYVSHCVRIRRKKVHDCFSEQKKPAGVRLPAVVVETPRLAGRPARLRGVTRGVPRGVRGVRDADVGAEQIVLRPNLGQNRF